MLDIQYNEKSNVFYFSKKDNNELVQNMHIAANIKMPIKALHDNLKTKFNGKPYPKNLNTDVIEAGISTCFNNKIDAENALNWINSMYILSKFEVYNLC